MSCRSMCHTTGSSSNYVIVKISGNLEEKGPCTMNW